MKTLPANRRARHEITENVLAVHPVIRAHPVSGRRLIYVNDTFTRGIVTQRYAINDFPGRRVVHRVGFIAEPFEN